MRLHVGVLGAEQLLGAVAGQVLDDVGEFAAAVIALAGIAFGVLVGEDAAGGFEHRFGGEVLAGDQFELRVLALGFVLDGLVNFGVDFGESAGHACDSVITISPGAGGMRRALFFQLRDFGDAAGVTAAGKFGIQKDVESTRARGLRPGTWRRG